MTKFEMASLLMGAAIIVSVAFFVARPVSAQTVTPAVMMEKEGTSTASAEEATETAEKKSDYQLPYAGLLPDHPLYVIKTLRDRIMDFLITDPIKKAEFTLLAADKRIAAASALVDKGKPELAESTASKGEAYLFRSISIAKEAKLENTQKAALVTKLVAAMAKHEEILGALAEKTEGRVRDRFNAIKSEVGKQRQSL